MIHYHRLGDVPPKHHVTQYEDGKLLMEQCITRAGFDSTYSILYYRSPPTDECGVRSTELPGFCPIEPVDEQLLYRRHIRTQDLEADGDFLTGFVYFNPFGESDFFIMVFNLGASKPVCSESQ